MQPIGRIDVSSQRAHSRRRETHLNKLNSNLRDSLKAIQENYEMMISRAKLENQAILSRCDPYSLATQEHFECSVRSANIVNACESITRLVSEIKLLLILGDFQWLEDSVNTEREERENRTNDLLETASRLRESISRDLLSIEEVLGSTPRRSSDENSSVDVSSVGNFDKLHPPN